MSNTTLHHYLQARRQHINTLTPDLAQLIEQVAASCVEISAALHQGALAGILGSADSDNVQGEVQKKLDVLSNDMLIDAVLKGGKTAAMASEEMDVLIPANADGKYLLMFDPLDGSSNIDVNMSVGTIFSILPYTGNGTVQTSDFFSVW
jgi:fructose-1,6-bisphosphatase I